MADEKKFWIKNGCILVNDNNIPYYDDHCCCDKQVTKQKVFAVFIDINYNPNTHTAAPFPHTVGYSGGDWHQGSGDSEQVLGHKQFNNGLTSASFFFPAQQRYIFDFDEDVMTRKYIQTYTVGLRSSQANINIVKQNSQIFIDHFVSGNAYNGIEERRNVENLSLNFSIPLDSKEILLTSLVLNNSNYSVEDPFTLSTIISNVVPPYGSQYQIQTEGPGGTQYPVYKDGNKDTIINVNDVWKVYNSQYSTWETYTSGMGNAGDEYIIPSIYTNIDDNGGGANSWSTWNNYFHILNDCTQRDGITYDKVYDAPIKFQKDIFVKKIITGSTEAYEYSQTNPLTMIDKEYDRFSIQTCLGIDINLTDGGTLYFYFKQNGDRVTIYYCEQNGEDWVYHLRDKKDTEPYPITKKVLVEDARNIIPTTIIQNTDILETNKVDTGYRLEFYAYFVKNQFIYNDGENDIPVLFDFDTGRFYYNTEQGRYYFENGDEFSGMWRATGEYKEIETQWDSTTYSYHYTFEMNDIEYEASPKWYIYKRISSPTNLIESIGNNDWTVRQGNLNPQDFNEDYVLHYNNNFYKLLPSGNDWYFYQENSSTPTIISSTAAAPGSIDNMPSYWYSYDKCNNIFKTRYKPWYNVQLAKLDTGLGLDNEHQWYVYRYGLGEIVIPECLESKGGWIYIPTEDRNANVVWAGYGYYYLSNEVDPYPYSEVYYFHATLSAHSHEESIYWDNSSKHYYYNDPNKGQTFVYEDDFVPPITQRYIYTALNYQGLYTQDYDLTNLVTGEEEYITLYTYVTDAYTNVTTLEQIYVKYDSYLGVFRWGLTQIVINNLQYIITKLEETDSYWSDDDTYYVYEYGNLKLKQYSVNGNYYYTFGTDNSIISLTDIIEAGSGVFIFNNEEYVYRYEYGHYFIKRITHAPLTPNDLAHDFWNYDDLNGLKKDSTRSHTMKFVEPLATPSSVDIVKIGSNWYIGLVASEEQIRSSSIYYIDGTTRKFISMTYNENTKVLECSKTGYGPQLSYNGYDYNWYESKGYGRQDSNTGEFIFDVNEVLEEAGTITDQYEYPCQYDSQYCALRMYRVLAPTGNIIAWSSVITTPGISKSKENQVFILKDIYYDKENGQIVNDINVQNLNSWSGWTNAWTQLKKEDKKFINTNLALKNINPFVQMHTYRTVTYFYDVDTIKEQNEDPDYILNLGTNVQNNTPFYEEVNSDGSTDHWLIGGTYTFYSKDWNDLMQTWSSWRYSKEISNTEFVKRGGYKNGEFENNIFILRKITNQKYPVHYNTSTSDFYIDLSDDQKFRYYYIHSNDVLCARYSSNNRILLFDGQQKSYYYVNNNTRYYISNIQNINPYNYNYLGLQVYYDEEKNLFYSQCSCFLGNQQNSYDQGFLGYVNNNLVQVEVDYDGNTSKDSYYEREYFDKGPDYDSYHHSLSNRTQVSNPYYSTFDLLNFQRHYERIIDIDTVSSALADIRGIQCQILTACSVNLKGAKSTKNMKVYGSFKQVLQFDIPYQFGINASNIFQLSSFSSHPNYQYVSAYIQPSTPMKSTPDFYTEEKPPAVEDLDGIKTLVIVRPIRSIGVNQADPVYDNNENSGSDGSNSGEGGNGGTSWQDVEGAHEGDGINPGMNMGGQGGETPP